MSFSSKINEKTFQPVYSLLGENKFNEGRPIYDTKDTASQQIVVMILQCEQSGAPHNFLLSNVKELIQPKINYQCKPQLLQKKLLQNSQIGQINLNSKATYNCCSQSNKKSILTIGLELKKAGNVFSLNFHTVCTYTKPAVIWLLLGAEGYSYGVATSVCTSSSASQQVLKGQYICSKLPDGVLLLMAFADTLTEIICWQKSQSPTVLSECYVFFISVENLDLHDLDKCQFSFSTLWFGHNRSLIA